MIVVLKELLAVCLSVVVVFFTERKHRKYYLDWSLATLFDLIQMHVKLSILVNGCIQSCKFSYPSTYSFVNVAAFVFFLT